MPATSQSTMTAQYLGQQIRAARARVEITQAELGRRLGTSPSYIAGIEAGKANVTIGQLASIANALRVGLEITFPVIQDEE